MITEDFRSLNTIFFSQRVNYGVCAELLPVREPKGEGIQPGAGGSASSMVS